MSVNECFQGRRFRTKKYDTYEEELSLLLPPVYVPEGKLCIEYHIGLSSKNADVDNVCKPLTDILQKQYNFNDKRVYQFLLKKVDVKKGEEFIRFNISAYGE